MEKYALTAYKNKHKRREENKFCLSFSYEIRPNFPPRIEKMEVNF